MPVSPVYFWKRTPFIRFLVPLATGIVLQWYCQLPARTWWIMLIASLVFKNIFSFISFFKRFKLAWLNGLGMLLLLVSLGALLTWYHDIRNNRNWFGHWYSGTEELVVSLDEPLVEKAKSLKANASVHYIGNDKFRPVKGKIILYLKKDSIAPGIGYGSTIIFKRALQGIRNAGNPGGFDYKSYCLFQDITHQVYLKQGEFEIIDNRPLADLNGSLYTLREKILTALRSNIAGEKEQGLAEALLIGYKDDLDKTLVQSYSNTGVVHIIAISGMHLALIYWVINLLLKPIGKRKKWRWIKALLAISILWTFSLLTGASASVLRASVMFTFILIADSFSRKSNIYNTLAASAFCLLCYNPFWLWDVGFQLSYAAVLSIVLFMQPIYHLLYFKNKLLDNAWKLNAVTFAAQILTTPLSIYHFHQFPSYFFLSNFIAVPLSSIIVLGEILLCAISFVTPAAAVTGKIISWLITLMNNYVERIASLPGSLWDGLQINVPQTILLFVIIAGLSYWLMEKLRNGLIAALLGFLGFFLLRSYSFIVAERRQKVIVYNVPQHRAIDFISGRNCFFYGDSAILSDDFAKNFHLKPARTRDRVSPGPFINSPIVNKRFAVFGNCRILMIDTALSFSVPAEKTDIDLFIISNNPRLYIAKLADIFNIKEVVFDGSVPFWKLPYLKKDCDSLHIPYHDVTEKGAFVMNLN